jgi:1-acyl-sn-glycerol-3-phosphate acyltransferase
MLHDLWYRFNQLICWTVAIYFFTIRAFRRHHMPGRGGVLLVSNHQSFWDPMLVALGLSREVNFMARESLFRIHPLFTWFLSSVNVFPVRRGEADLGAIKETLRRIRAGGVVLMFPEGTRTLDGSIGPLMPGIHLLAKKCGVPVVPACIDGAFESWPRHQKLPRPYPIRVMYGPAFSAAEVAASTPEDFTRRLRAAMIALQVQLTGRVIPHTASAPDAEPEPGDAGEAAEPSAGTARAVVRVREVG